MDEREAIQRLKRGDISGLEALVRRYQLAAMRAAYLVTRERALAEDVVQSAFLKVYDRIDQFDAARPFGAWFYTTILRDAIKAARQRARASPIDRPHDLTEPSDPEDGPEHALERAETADEVAAALAHLTPEQRAAIVARYFLGLSELQMSQQLGIPRSTVKWRLHAARQRLRLLLDPLSID